MKRAKHIAVGMAVLILAFAASTAVICLYVGKRENADKERLTRVIAADIYNSIASELLPPIAISETMSHDAFLRQALRDENTRSQEDMVAVLSDYLTQIKEGVGAFTAFVVSDGSRRYYSYEGLNKVIAPESDAHDIWYSIFVDGRKEYDIDVDTDQVNGDSWTVFVNCRIEDESGKLLGVCGIGTGMDSIQETLRKYEQEYDVKVNLVNKEGIVQVDTSSINIDSRYLYNIEYGEVKDFICTTDKDGSCAVTRYIDNLGWYLAVRNEASDSRAYLPVIVRNLICFGVAAFLYLGLCLFLDKKDRQTPGSAA